jgi:hypothetical protein
MSSSYEDHLLRQLRAFAAALARAIGLRHAGSIEEARVALERAYQFLLGDLHDVLRSVDVITAAQMLCAADRIAACARLVREEAELSGDPANASSLRSRAMGLAIEALLRGYEDEEFVSFARDLAREADPSHLTAAHREKYDSLRSRS